MNRNIKRIIATSLSVTALSVVVPAKYLKIMNFSQIAYASSSDDDIDADALEASYLDDLNISEDGLSFSEKKTDYTIKIDKNTESITVRAKAKDPEDTIKINNEQIKLDNNNVAEKVIQLDKGKNLIRIKLVTEDYGLRIYNLVVNRGSADASDSSDSSVPYLNNINLSDGDLSFSKKTTSYNTNVNSSTNEIRITAQPEDDDYEVKIDGVKVDKDEDYRRTVELKNGNNSIPIDIVDDDGGEQSYTININRGGTSSSDTSEVIDNKQDPIYLDDIVIQDGDVPLNFKPKVTSYAVDVSDSTDSILIKAKPEYDDKVYVNGDLSKDLYVRRVNLNEGKNVITIKINNSESYDKGDADYEERTYTLTVYRGTSQGTSQNNSKGASGGITGQSTAQQNSSSQSGVKISQWVQVNGKWQYNDDLGNPLKSTFYFDKNYGKSYYFKEDGTMATGWILYNSNWYYLDDSGAMKTGWIKDYNGSWYYLDSSGVMVKNTTINGYKIGSNGAWVS